MVIKTKELQEGQCLKRKEIAGGKKGKAESRRQKG
jgi:hypothetical protein